MKNKKYNSGFTLVETMIYVALFAIIMSGAIVSIYGIISSSTRNATKAMVQEEGSFLVGKIDWVLSKAAHASVSADGLSLTIQTFDSPAVIMEISVSSDGESMSIDTDVVGGIYDGQNLNNSNVTITCNPPAGGSGCFTYNTGTGDGINPESVTADFTLNTRTSEGLSYSQEFSTIKYLRK